MVCVFISSVRWLQSKLLLQQNCKFSFPLKPPAWQLTKFSTVIDFLNGIQTCHLSFCHGSGEIPHLECKKPTKTPGATMDTWKTTKSWWIHYPLCQSPPYLLLPAAKIFNGSSVLALKIPLRNPEEPKHSLKKYQSTHTSWFQKLLQNYSNPSRRWHWY